MTSAAVPSIGVHHRPAWSRVMLFVVAALVAGLAAKGIYELVDVLDGTGTRAVAPAVEVEAPAIPYGSADAAERWMVETPAAPFGSADAAERWTVAPAAPFGSADATERWVTEPAEGTSMGTADAAEHWAAR